MKASESSSEPTPPPNASPATLADVSQEEVGKLLGRARQRWAAAQKQKQPPTKRQKKNQGEGEGALFWHRQAGTEKSLLRPGFGCGAPAVVADAGPTHNRSGLGHQTNDEAEEEEEEDVNWEEGDWNGQIMLQVEGKHSPLSACNKRRTSKPMLRRATAKDKEFCLLVHKAHLLCLLARGRLVDAACDHPVLQACLLSLLPRHLLPAVTAQQPTTERLLPLVQWFHTAFQVLPSAQGIKLDHAVPFASRLQLVLTEKAGTAEEIAAMSVALFRSLGFSTRRVSVLDASSTKPDAESLEASANWESDVADDIHGFLVTDQTHAQVASLAQVVARFSSAMEASTYNSARRAAAPVDAKQNNGPCPARKVAEMPVDDMLTNKGENDGQVPAATGSSSDHVFTGSTLQDSSRKTYARTKGEEEFEMQLAMAITATAAAVAEGQTPLTDGAGDLETSGEATHGSGSASQTRRVGDKAGVSSLFAKRKKESTLESQRLAINAPAWSRTMGPLLHWAEVFCDDGKASVRRWVHVDAAMGIIDGVDKLQAAAAACRLPLRYVVGFAGSGAKDLTQRYAPLWSVIAPLRVEENWWNKTLDPLKCLEAAATGITQWSKQAGAAPVDNLAKREGEPESVPLTCQLPSASDRRSDNHEEACENMVRDMRGPDQKPEAGSPSTVYGSSSRDVNEGCVLEDVELQMRTSREPLPTNQQAYRKHHLYALEKWLTKYQAVYPKSPVLGYCGGQPVYPRSCVRVLHTAEHWLRKCRKVVPGEAPFKMVKKSRLAGGGKEASEGGQEQPTVALFGEWQTQPWRPPAAVNGIVPKNERQQVDVWSEECLPPGTVHLRYPRLEAVARRLGVDYASAFVGFEMRKGQSFPLFQGIVVCREFEGAVLDAYFEEEHRRAAALMKKREEEAMLRWRQLLRSMATRERLQCAYKKCDDSPSRDIKVGETETADGGIGTTHEDHVHQFVEYDDRPLDQAAGTRVKVCRCGFFVEVEEI